MSSIAAAPLAASLLTLASGPMVLLVAAGRPALMALRDGFVLAAIGGIVLLDVLPHALLETNLLMPMGVAAGV